MIVTEIFKCSSKVRFFSQSKKTGWLRLCWESKIMPIGVACQFAVPVHCDGATPRDEQTWANCLQCPGSSVSLIKHTEPQCPTEPLSQPPRHDSPVWSTNKRVNPETHASWHDPQFPAWSVRAVWGRPTHKFIVLPVLLSSAPVSVSFREGSWSKACVKMQANWATWYSTIPLFFVNKGNEGMNNEPVTRNWIIGVFIAKLIYNKGQQKTRGWLPWAGIHTVEGHFRSFLPFLHILSATAPPVVSWSPGAPWCLLLGNPHYNSPHLKCFSPFSF